MQYTIQVETDVRHCVTSWTKQVQSAELVNAYILQVIDQPDIQELLSEVEFHACDAIQIGFVPLADEIDAMCDGVVFHAGEEIGCANWFGIRFTVTRKRI
jgi:hypothetical protein